MLTTEPSINTMLEPRIVASSTQAGEHGFSAFATASADRSSHGALSIVGLV
jgi:hypothetical protein